MQWFNKQKPFWLSALYPLAFSKQPYRTCHVTSSAPQNLRNWHVIHRAIITRPHRSTTVYVRRCRLLLQMEYGVVCPSVCQSVTIARPAKTVEPIEMPFGLWTWVGPRKHALDGGGPDPACKWAIFRAGNWRPIIRTLYRELLKKGWTDRYATLMCTRMSPRKQY